MAVTRHTVADNSSLTWSTVSPSEDDLVIIIWSNDGGDGDDPTTPGDFTRISDAPTKVGSHYSLVCYRICTGSESGDLIDDEQNTFSVASSEGYGAHVFHFPAADWHGTTAPEMTQDEGSGTESDAPSNSWSWGAETDTFVIAAATQDGSFTGDTITAAPTNYSTNYAQTNSSSAGSVVVASSYRTVSTSSEDVGTWTMDSNESGNYAFCIAVRPAASGGTTHQEDADGMSVAVTLSSPTGTRIAHGTAALDVAVTLSSPPGKLTARRTAAVSSTVTLAATGQKGTVKEAADGVTVSVTLSSPDGQRIAKGQATMSIPVTLSNPATHVTRRKTAAVSVIVSLSATGQNIQDTTARGGAPKWFGHIIKRNRAKEFWKDTRNPHLPKREV